MNVYSWYDFTIYIHFLLFFSYMLLNLIHIDLITHKKDAPNSCMKYSTLHQILLINLNKDFKIVLTNLHVIIYHNNQIIYYLNIITIIFVISCKVELHGSVWRNHLSLNSIYADILNLTFLCPPYSLNNCYDILSFILIFLYDIFVSSVLFLFY